MTETLIHLDFETRSTVKAQTHGSWGYSIHPTTDIWCFAFRADGDKSDPKVWVPGMPVPDILAEPFVCVAHNYRFEQAIWLNILMPRYGFPIAPHRWICTMALAYRHNLPGALDKLAVLLGIDERKDVQTKDLMMRMHNRKRYDPTHVGSMAHKHHAENFQKLVTYNQQDVRVEDSVFQYFRHAAMDYEEFGLDQRINDRGIKVDVESAAAISRVVHQQAAQANERLTELTLGCVQTGRQVASLMKWLEHQGYPGQDVRAGTVDSVLKSPSGMTTIGLEVLKLRKRTALGSLAKFDVMIRAADPRDSRLRGMFQLYGASQTGRWGGRLVQPQNLPRMQLKDDDVELAIQLFKAGDVETIEMLFGDPMQVAKDLIRPMFIGEDKLIVSDLSQIECRTLAWLAGCLDLLELFQDPNRDPYSEVASEIYEKPVDQCGKGTSERFVGKATVLGCGYGMGGKTFAVTLANSGHDMELVVAQHIVHTYRSTFPQIPMFWRNLESCFRSILADASRDADEKTWHCGELKLNRVTIPNRIDVIITLPSGRTLYYNHCKLHDDSLTYITEKGFRNNTYGGKLVENVTQAVARDILADAMKRLDAAGLPVVGHVHDEVLVSVESGTELDAEKVNHIMQDNPSWAKGLPLAAETAIATRYTK